MNSIEKQKFKEYFLVIVKALIIMLSAGIVILSFLPKAIAFVSDQIGFPLYSSDLVTKYSMGIAVRLLGLLVFLYIMLKKGILKKYTLKINRSNMALCWLFIVYIFFNIEFVPIENLKPLPVILMISESLMIGLYEEIVFRGLLLGIFLEKWGNNKKQLVCSVLLSSILFGLFHLFNLFSGVTLTSILYQIYYTIVIAIAFSALLIRTNGNLLLCALIHGFYDMASGFGDFADKLPVSNAESQSGIQIFSYISGGALFIPLLVYALFLLRKVNTGKTSE